MTVFIWIWILLLIFIFFRLIIKYDSSHGLKLGAGTWAAAIANALAASILISHRRYPALQGLLYGILAAYLATASITDRQTKMVHDFLHLPGGLAGVSLLIYRWPDQAVFWEAVIFFAIQMLIFRRLYGTADCLVFCVCALYLAAEGQGMMTYLLHMGASFLLLAVVQIFRKNINRQGNLKEPVALVPYITVSMWIFLVSYLRA